MKVVRIVGRGYVAEYDRRARERDSVRIDPTRTPAARAATLALKRARATKAFSRTA